ncbi:MAG: magnesium/cobalt transporter CorA [Nitrospiraceae bacterium]|nr:magnesium/cobalt transporter CorA [Nitrospiraceae bacterium]
MPKLMKNRSRKSGLPPGTLIHIGEQKDKKPKITIIDYDDSSFQEKEVEEISECYPFRNKPSVSWINVEGLHRVEILEKLGECYGLHPLVLEDILNTDQRPKMEDYGDYLYIVLKMLHFEEVKGTVEAEQISLVLGEQFVISFQEGLDGDVFQPVRERLRNNKGRIRKLGADYLVYSLIDAIVDNYFIILEKTGESIEDIEEKVLGNPSTTTLNDIHFLKREMIFLRKAVWPLREVVSGLERGDSALVRGSTKVFLRDIYDHTIQVIDTIETFRDMTSGMLDIYLSSVNNRMSAVMKVLTIIATIFMPLTFIAGVYGMNFKYMPELEWRWSYPALWAIIILIAASMVAYFKKKKWW